MPVDNPVSAADLAALLAARLCHDLVSPISAVGNAISVLEDPDAEDMHADAMELVKGSARQAWAKLEFSRLAFGAGGSAPGSLEAHEVRRVADDMFAASKSSLEWRLNVSSFEKSVARTLLNLILLGVEALPRGGVVTIEAAADGERLRVMCEGKRARLAPGVADALEGRAPENGYDARSIQPYYAGLLAREAGGRASARLDGERVEFAALMAVSRPVAVES